MNIISVKEKPEYKDTAIQYFQSKWANKDRMMVYEDCIANCITSSMPLPQWYLLWICSLYVEKSHRGKALGSVLLEKAKEDAKKGGFSSLYLCTEHIGYYEKYGFTYIGQGYHSWGESSRIYEIDCSVR